MILTSLEIARYLELKLEDTEDPLFFAPKPNMEDLKTKGAAAIDLRLGTWFVTAKTSKHHLMDVYEDEDKQPSEQSITNKHYVPFGKNFILHPHSFVLAATLEWIKMPRSLCGYVTGKSSWGRRGLVIETAPGVHPGFTGCLTLELANVGEIPIAIRPGTHICQLFIHKVTDGSLSSQSTFNGNRHPVLGNIKLDTFAKNLADNSAEPK